MVPETLFEELTDVLEKFGSIRLKNKISKSLIFRKLQYNLSIVLG